MGVEGEFEPGLEQELVPDEQTEATLRPATEAAVVASSNVHESWSGTVESSAAAKDEIRSGTRTANLEGRSQLAHEIREMRREARRDQESISREVEALREEIASGKATLEMMTSGVDRMRTQQHQQERVFANGVESLAHGILMPVSGLPLNEQARLLIEKEILASGLSKLVQNNEALRYVRDKAKEKLQMFYAAEAEKREASERLRDVREMSKREGVLIVHGIHHLGSPSQAPMLGNEYRQAQDIGFADKLKVFLALEPTSSTSTVRPGQKHAFWADQGVILGSGRVESASAVDAYSGASSPSKRSASGGETQADEQFSQSLQDALTRMDGYNELITADPSVAGLYMNFKEGRSVQTEASVNDEQMQVEASRYNVPVIAIQDGVPYATRFNTETKSFELGSQQTVEQVLAGAPTRLDGSRKQQLVDEVLREIPFGFQTDTIRELKTITNTRDLYNRVRMTTHSPYELPVGQIYGTVPQVGGTKEYYMLTDARGESQVGMRFLRLDGVTVDKGGDWTDPSRVFEQVQFDGSTTTLELQSTSELRDALQNNVIMLRHQLSERPEDQVLRHRLQQETFRLLACRDQAALSGDKDIASSIESFAQESMKEEIEQYTALTHQRTDARQPNAYRIVREDIG